MSKIIFSLSGEGRGHATRVRTVVEALRKSNHHIIILAPGDAYKFLRPIYKNTEIEVKHIRGLKFHYDASRKLDIIKTAFKAFIYLMWFDRLVKQIVKILIKEKPDLVISDFEPALPKAAKRLDIPFISLTHQHFLTHYDLSSLPVDLRYHALYMGLVVNSYYVAQAHTIISSFYFPPLVRNSKDATQVGVLLREDIRKAVPEVKEHVLAYLRRNTHDNVLKALEGLEKPVKVYGLGEHKQRGNLTFHAIDEVNFLNDLRTCHSLISTAGNQLVGEALYLRKPCFVIPESGNYEQYINAHFLAKMRCGMWEEVDCVTTYVLKQFLYRREELVNKLDVTKLDGLIEVLRIINEFLPCERKILRDMEKCKKCQFFDMIEKKAYKESDSGEDWVCELDRRGFVDSFEFEISEIPENCDMRHF